MIQNNNSASFIESGIILNTRFVEDFKSHNFNAKDFVILGDVYNFILEYSDVYQVLPTLETLYDKFNDLEEDAEGGSLTYFIKTFNDQTITRKAADIIKEEGKKLISTPRIAVGNIVSRLEKINQDHDEEVYIHDGQEASERRFKDFLNRRSILENKKGMKLLGVPTPIARINSFGIGVQGGEICSLVARPAVGKSWFSVKAAALNAHLGNRTMIVTAELPAEQIAIRFDVFLAKLKGYEFSHKALKIGSKEIDEDEYQKFLKESSKDRGNLIIVDHISDFGLSIKGISSLVRQHRPSVLVVDNMELLTSDSGNYNKAMWERMSEVYYGLKHLSVANDLAVFTTIQANRDASDPFKPPGRTEIAAGDAMLRASDMVFSMCLSRDGDNKRLIAFQKMRDLPDVIDYVTMDFNPDIGIFEQEV